MMQLVRECVFSLSRSVWTRSRSEERGTFCVRSGNVSSENLLRSNSLIICLNKRQILSSSRWLENNRPLVLSRRALWRWTRPGQVSDHENQHAVCFYAICDRKFCINNVKPASPWCLLAAINPAAENRTIKQSEHDGDDDGCKQQPVRIWKLRGKLDSPVQLLMTINGRMGRPIGFLAAVRWEVVSLHEVNAEFPYRLHIYHSDMLHQRCRAPGGHDPHWEDASEHWACQHHNLDSGGPRWISIFLLLWLVSYL